MQSPIRLTVLILLSFLEAFGQENSTLNKNCKQPEFACGECETGLQNDFNQLLNSLLEKPLDSTRWSTDSGVYKTKPDIKADQFIKQALDVMRKNNPKGDGRLNMIVIGQSESLHETTPNNPRVAIKSPDGEFWLTFNTDPNAAGYNNVEIMRWDGKAGAFKFQEIAFSQDRQKGGHIDMSGQKCVKCHREPMRPNWDTYRSWSNVLPPRDDLVEMGQSGKMDVAGRSYMSFLNKIKEAKLNPTGANERLSFLEIPGDGATDNAKLLDIKKNVASEGFFRVPHYPPAKKLGNYSIKTAELAGSSHLGFDQLSGQNMCKIVNDLKKNLNFDKFKYAIVGIMNCSGSDRSKVDWNELKKYVPASFQKESFEYFSKSTSLNLANEKVKPKNSQDVLNSIFMHTQKSHQSVNRAKDDRAKKMLSGYSQLPSVKGTPNEINHVLTKVTDVPSPYTAISDPGGVQSVAESDPGVISSLRYILEPMGINVSSWSMVSGRSVADTTFSFSDQFADIFEEQSFISDIFKETPGSSNTEKCRNLQQLSHKALDGALDFTTSSSGNQFLDQLCVQTTEPEIVAEKIKSELGQTTCLVCHSSVHTHVAEMFGPNSKMSLNQQLSNGKSLASHAKEQLNSGRMPPGGWGIGSDEKEKLKNDQERREAVIKYIDYASGKTSFICQQGSVTPVVQEKSNVKKGNQK